MDPEHANLGANEITLVFGRMPATLVLHQLVHSPEMRQATLASLLGKRARRSVRFHGSDISIPAYLPIVSRLCREVAEHSEAESEQNSVLGETMPMSEYQLAVDSETLAGSVGRNGRNVPSDVKLVQRLINANLPIPLAPLAEDGETPCRLGVTIRYFRQETLAVGIVDFALRGEQVLRITKRVLKPHVCVSLPDVRDSAGFFSSRFAVTSNRHQKQ
jgi:hypothetical protein